MQWAVKELNYVANTHARALVAGSTQTVAFIINDVRGPAFAAAVHGAEQEAGRPRSPRPRAGSRDTGGRWRTTACLSTSRAAPWRRSSRRA
ncbi:hypothetical protein [Nonomuraea turcica]|uniref:hypothetical protein n=1 Tax=Nonomuraea sp. G32 TaxID=3067274 RepID=UPI00273A927E|nr:hypothetical protein [Nonomuraea sp. G32]MDP4502252.1 hypothetical protein [Nonomuraea sp. G32]